MKEVKIVIDSYKTSDYFYICHIYDTIVELCISNDIQLKCMTMDKNGGAFSINIMLPKESTSDFSKDKIVDDLMHFKDDIKFLVDKYKDKMKDKLKHPYILFVIRLLLLLCASKANVMYDYIKNEEHDINVLIPNHKTNKCNIYRKQLKTNN